MKGKRGYIIFPEVSIGAALFPLELSQFLNHFYRTKGVEVMPGRAVTAVRSDQSGIVLVTSAEPSIQVDAVVAGIGIEPETRLA